MNNPNLYHAVFVQAPIADVYLIPCLGGMRFMSQFYVPLSEEHQRAILKYCYDEGFFDDAFGIFYPDPMVAALIEITPEEIN